MNISCSEMYLCLGQSRRWAETYKGWTKRLFPPTCITLGKYTRQHIEPLLSNQWSFGNRQPCKSFKNANCCLFLYQNNHGQQPASLTVYMQWHVCWKGHKRRKKAQSLVKFLDGEACRTVKPTTGGEWPWRLMIRIFTYRTLSAGFHTNWPRLKQFNIKGHVLVCCLYKSEMKRSVPPSGVRSWSA